MYKLVNGVRTRLTDEEIARHLSETNLMEERLLNNLKKTVKQKRNQLLLESDWTQMPDSPITDPEVKALWKEYRQALRDITNQSNYPHHIEWPTKP